MPNKHIKTGMLHKNYSTIDQQPRTALTVFDRQNKSTLDMYRTSKFSNADFDRPNTSFLVVHRLNTASHRKRVQFADQTQIDSVEQDLEATYQLDLNGYLHKKFRNFLIRKHEGNPPKPTIVTIQNPEMLNTFCSKMEVSLMLDEGKQASSTTMRPHRTIQTAYLLNAKERISRLVELKRERQATYSRLRQAIKQKCKKKERSFAVIGPHTLNTNQDKQLSQKIKNQYRNQIERYKQRISSKLRIKSFRKAEISKQ